MFKLCVPMRWEVFQPSVVYENGVSDIDKKGRLESSNLAEKLPEQTIFTLNELKDHAPDGLKYIRKQDGCDDLVYVQPCLNRLIISVASFDIVAFFHFAAEDVVELIDRHGTGLTMNE